MPRTPAGIDEIVRRSDRGEPVAHIAKTMGLSEGWVYDLLRRCRPDRPHKVRKLMSDIPDKVRALCEQGMSQSRVASSLGVTRQYVNKILRRRLASRPTGPDVG